MTNDGWTRVGRAIAERIDDLGVTKAEVIRRSGVSGTSLDAYISGQPIKRRDKLTGLCAALGWTPGSIEAIANGRTPTLVAADAPTNGDRPDLEHRVSLIEGRLSATEEKVDQILREIRGRSGAGR